MALHSGTQPNLLQTRQIARGYAVIEYFPNTCPPVPVPAVLTAEEAVRYLRLDEGGKPPKAAQRAFRRLVETKRVRPARIGIHNRFAREELRRFVLHATQLSGEATEI